MRPGRIPSRWNGAEFIEFIWTRVYELFDTEFDQVRYADIGIAYWLSGCLVAIVLLTVARRWFKPTRHSRHHSGHRIDRRLQRRHFATFSVQRPQTTAGILGARAVHRPLGSVLDGDRGSDR